MPSAALTIWQAERTARLQQVEGQCAAALAAVPPNLLLIDENLRGYVVLLSAHFQGFCRDLYTVVTDVIVSRVRRSLQQFVRTQFMSSLRLDRGNPSAENIRADFERFNLPVNLSADSDNATRLTDLAALNTWRNVAAHHGAIPAGPALNLHLIAQWRRSCNGLAVSLDALLYNNLRRLLRRSPWVQ
jgi:hypothetical protein